MYRDTLEAPLAQLGLSPKNFHALRVLPLIYVAWANKKLTAAERDQILDVARNRLELNGEAMHLVHHWLSGPPTKALIVDAVSCLKRAANAPDQPDFGSDDLLQILWDAESMTRKVAILTGTPYEPSQEQHDALLELAELIGLDTGMPWLDLLMDIGGQPEAQRTLTVEGQAQVRDAKPRSAPQRQDRARRWRTALRLHSSHDHRVNPPGGVI